MMLTVAQVQKSTGVSVRTLHYYDELGLLMPTVTTEAGYRLYDDAALERLQLILFFRELEFPLKEIQRILDQPGFDRKAALRDQIELLKMQRAPLTGLIELASKELKGESVMEKFEAFDKKAISDYAEEAKKRWGNTEAFGAFEKKTAGYKDGDFAASNDKLMQVFKEFAAVRKAGAESSEAAAVAAKLQKTITDNFYPCTDEILAGLADMYVADERFAKALTQTAKVPQALPAPPSRRIWRTSRGGYHPPA